MIKQKYLGNYSKLTPELHKAVSMAYASGSFTTEQISKHYGISTRQVQRIATKHKVIRSQAEANRTVAPLKHYKTIPKDLRVQRKQLTQKLRYEIISNHPYCTVCGDTSAVGVRLEVDHIDNDATNNERSNLQVLCQQCNTGKSHLHRFGATQ